MKAHIVENGVVVNTIEVESLDFLPNLVEATDGSIGWHYESGVFTNPNALTQAELDVLAADAVRARRDAIMTEEDWRTTKAFETGVPLSAEWLAYRNALRDITDHVKFPYLDDADWPVKPI